MENTQESSLVCKAIVVAPLPPRDGSEAVQEIFLFKDSGSRPKGGCCCCFALLGVEPRALQMLASVLPLRQTVIWPLEVQGLLVGQSEALPVWGVSYTWKKDDGYLCGSVLSHKKRLRGF